MDNNNNNINSQNPLTLEGHTNYVNFVAFSPDGTKIVSGSQDKTIKLWDTSTGVVIKTLEGHSNAVRSVAFSPDGTKIVSGSWDKTIKLWDTITGTLIRTLEGHGDYVTSVAFSRDGTKIVSGSFDSTIKLFNTITGALIRTFECDNLVWSIAIDGTMIVFGSPYPYIPIRLDATTGAMMPTLEGHSNAVRSVAFSPDGTKIVSGSWDKTIKLWDTITGTLIRTLEGHGDYVTSVAFSPDGTKIVSGSEDKTIKLWDVSTGALIQTLQGHDDIVISVAFNRDGTKIVSGSWDKTIKLWDILFSKYEFTQNLYTNEVVEWLRVNEIEYTFDHEGDKLIFHVMKKDHPLLLDIIVSSEGYKVERPGSLLLENMITKEACENIRKQKYTSIEDLIIDLYISFAHSKEAEKYKEYKLKF